MVTDISIFPVNPLTDLPRTYFGASALISSRNSGQRRIFQDCLKLFSESGVIEQIGFEIA